MRFLFTKQARWYRIGIFISIFILLPIVLEQSWSSYKRYTYENSPIENYYQAVSMEADNVCHGDITQHVKSVRFVFGTKTGWAADVVRELSVVTEENERSKVFEETADIFIERTETGVATREAAIPPLEVGLYQWQVTLVRLYLPFGVIRVDVSPVSSNVFAVKKCKE